MAEESKKQLWIWVKLATWVLVAMYFSSVALSGSLRYIDKTQFSCISANREKLFRDYILPKLAICFGVASAAGKSATTPSSGGPSDAAAYGWDSQVVGPFLRCSFAQGFGRRSTVEI